MKTLSKIYVKYLLKSGVVFYSFLLIGIIGFLLMTLSLKLDMVTTYDAYFAENRIVLNENPNTEIDSLYAYKARNEKVYSFTVTDVEYIDQYMILYIGDTDKSMQNALSGNIKVDIVAERRTLLEVIFVKAGKKDVK